MSSRLDMSLRVEMLGQRNVNFREICLTTASVRATVVRSALVLPATTLTLD